MKVPLIDLGAQHRALRGETLAALTAVLDEQRYINGPRGQRLEEQIAALCGARFGVGVSSGTDALVVSLMALDLRPGDEVITTPFTFFATAGCVARLGARPVFADINPETCNLDPAGLQDRMTNRTRAVLPVHLFGQMADMAAILGVARRNDLVVIEDAAQAIGATQGSSRAGGVGLAGCLSFYPTKNLGGVGDGGMIVTSDEGFAERLRLLRAHGSRPRYHHHAVGGNFRLDELQAAALLVRLPHLQGWNEARRRNAAYYSARFEGSPVRAPTVAPGNTSVFHQYTIRAPRRDALQTWLSERGVGTGLYYPVPLHLQPCFADLGYRQGQLPEAERAAREALSLPIQPELTQQQLDVVADAVLDFYARG
ncbi:MAG: DegT/DnrJ/EryC1/StrS family aminotransferase [Alphaproteobacteria bacterium]|nr:DegT/DnrJ/EryC1/StrS family aminotransferase [Alphaproteobacteria bacterium]